MLANPKGRAVNTLITLAALVIIIGGLRAAAPFFLPFLLALFLSLLSFPLLEWLRRKGVRLSLAVIVTTLADVAVLGVFVLLVTRSVARFTRQAPLYWDAMVAKVQRWGRELEAREIELSDWIDFDAISPGELTDFVGGVLRNTVVSVASTGSFTLLVLITMVCFLYESVTFPEKLQAAFRGTQYQSGYFTTITTEIRRYLGLKTLLSALTGVVVAFWLMALGVDFPIFWGLVAFLLNYIPVIGSIVAAVPTVALTIVQFGFGRAALVALGYLIVNLTIGNMLEPMVMGKSFGLSTLVVFFSLVFWGWLWGPVGMLLSVPLMIVIKVALKYTRDLGWIAVLMEPGSWAAERAAASREASGLPSDGGRGSESSEA